MANVLDAAQIEALWEALNQTPKKANPSSGAALLRRIASDGWAVRADIEDIFYLSDPRLDEQTDVKALCAAFALPWRSVYHQPKTRSNSIAGFYALAAVDVAELLIQVERLGFLVDPKPLVDLLLPSIKGLKRITNSELSILWFAKQRHKMAPQLVQIAERATGAVKSEQLSTSNGYVAEIWRDSAGQTLWLSVNAPRFRRRSLPQETICSDCGYHWYRGNPDSSANHRREHRLRMKILDPQPLQALTEARQTEKEPELVTTTSPAWKHKEIYERARFFRREFNYGFVQWDSDDGDSDPDVHGFLFSDDSDAIVGACAFRLRDHSDGKHWGLQWVWICPKARRTGVLANRWPNFRERFGEFHIEGPVSPAMEAFVVKQGDTKLLGYVPNLSA